MNCYLLDSLLTYTLQPPGEICSEMHAKEMHELYDRHHKVSPNLNSY